MAAGPRQGRSIGLARGDVSTRRGDATDGLFRTSDEHHGEAEPRQTLSAEIPVDPTPSGRAAAVGRAAGSQGDRALASRLSRGSSVLMRLTAVPHRAAVFRVICGAARLVVGPPRRLQPPRNPQAGAAWTSPSAHSTKRSVAPCATSPSARSCRSPTSWSAGASSRTRSSARRPIWACWASRTRGARRHRPRLAGLRHHRRGAVSRQRERRDHRLGPHQPRLQPGLPGRDR